MGLHADFAPDSFIHSFLKLQTPMPYLFYPSFLAPLSLPFLFSPPLAFISSFLTSTTTTIAALLALGCIYFPNGSGTPEIFAGESIVLFLACHFSSIFRCVLFFNLLILYCRRTAFCGTFVWNPRCQYPESLLYSPSSGTSALSLSLFLSFYLLLLFFFY